MWQTEEEEEFRYLLENTRIGYPSENKKDILLSLHLTVEILHQNKKNTF
jgi:hypothetical protein